MGLIRAAVSAFTGSIGDQFKDYFVCDALPTDVLAAKGYKQGRQGSDNIITTGSKIIVATGQCMLIVDQGKVVDICGEPGEYTYDASTEPSLFGGEGLAKNIKEVFGNIGKRFSFGGAAANDQRIYYINTKEIVGNKYGTANPVPFRVVDANAGIDADISIKCFGEYSYRITNPILFYTNICGNMAQYYDREEIDSQMKTELLTALQPAFAKISEMGIRYSALPAHTTEIADVLNEQLSNKWRDLRGIEIVSFGVSSVSADAEDEKRIKNRQFNAGLKDPTLAAAELAGAQAQAMQDAANNANGAAMGFMGVNMAQGTGGVNAASLYQMGANNQQPAAAADSWTCACGTVNTGKFCSQCGQPKPAQATCPKCGAALAAGAKFCPQCGEKIQ